MQNKFSLDKRNFSYWEKNVLAEKRDFIIVGAGLVGVSTAISLKEKYPIASILILERSAIPYGASTRNAGFACFGSMSEIIDDLDSLSKLEVEELIMKRWSGLKLLRGRIGDDNLRYEGLGGYELFSSSQQASYGLCIDRIAEINDLVFKSTGQRGCFNLTDTPFGAENHGSLIYNKYEGQIHPGMMMKHLQRIALAAGVEIQYGIDIANYNDNIHGITLSNSGQTLVFNASKLLITTNAFTATLIKGLDLKPGRNQVMMTKPIKNLKIKGCFHFDKGYVYFRDFEGRLLIGGGRNTATEAETTEDFGMTDQIKEYLRRLLQEVILPDTSFEEEMWWSGIIATGTSKKPIVKKVSENVYLGVRLGGMGVAMGSLIGQELAELV